MASGDPGRLGHRMRADPIFGVRVVLAPVVWIVGLIACLAWAGEVWRASLYGHWGDTWARDQTSGRYGVLIAIGVVGLLSTLAATIGWAWGMRITLFCLVPASLCLLVVLLVQFPK